MRLKRKSNLRAPRLVDNQENQDDSGKLSPPAPSQDNPRKSLGIRSYALTGIFVLAMLYTLYFTRDFLLPIVVALLLSFLLWPIVRALKKLGVPEQFGAALVLLGLVAGLGMGVFQLSGPAADWMAKAPQNLRQLKLKVETLQKPVEQVTKAAQQVEEITDLEQPQTRTVEVREPRLSEILFDGTWQLMTGILITAILLYFLLASGGIFLGKLLHNLPRLKDKKRVVTITRKLENNVSTYLLSITLINLGLGAAVAGAMYLLQMPNAILWGAMAAVLNFVPYLGAIVGLLVVSAVAFATYDGIAWPLLTAGVYLGLTAAEGTFITPMILGRHLTLNPVVIFLGVLFWGWLWGIPGILLAVPILSTVKLLCDHLKFESIAEFMEP